jgi:hypothetical protein
MVKEKKEKPKVAHSFDPNIFKEDNQDGRQTLGAVIAFGTEVIRAYAGAMLIWSVPHKTEYDQWRYYTVLLNFISM